MRFTDRLAGRASHFALVVLIALLAVVDIASRSLAPWLARATAARLAFLRVMAGGYAAAPSAAIWFLLIAGAVAVAIALTGDPGGIALAAPAGLLRVKELREKHKALKDEARAILAIADAERKPEQKARLEAITKEGGDLDTVEREHAAEQRLVDAERALIVGDNARVEVGLEAVDRIIADARRSEEVVRSARARRLSVFPATAGFAGPAPFGRFLQAVALRGGWNGEGLASDERTGLVAAASGGSANVSGEGGHLIRSQWSEILLNRVLEVSKLLPRTTSIPIGEGFDSIEAPYLQQTDRSQASTRFGGVQVYRTSEAEAATSTKIDAFKRFEVRLEDLTGLGYATNRLLRDAVALQGWITNAFTSAMGFKVDDELFRGTGAGQCLGAFNASNPCLVSQAKETGQAADTVVAQNVINMFARMHPGNMGGARWYINTEILPLLMTMYIATGTGGQLVYTPPGGLNDAPYGALLGRPVEALEHCAAKGDLGDIVFADYGDYITIDKGGIETAESMHVKFETNQMTFRFTYRMNGQPKEPAPITPYKGANTLSAFVALAAR